MYRLGRKFFSQNFLHNRKLVTELIRNSSIVKNDLVLEIGPGKGIITEQLTQHSQHIIGVEIDGHWYSYLKNKFSESKNLTLYHQDFLGFSLPALDYKVFANPPFSIEGKIVRKLLAAKNPPEDCYLVLMRELAERFCASKRENLFSVQNKPWFDLSIYHYFKKSDFSPIPNVSAVMLRIAKRKNPLLSWSERERYQDFVRVGFGHGLAVMSNLKKHFGQETILKAVNQVGVRKNTKPGNLTLQQWIQLYQRLLN